MKTLFLAGSIFTAACFPAFAKSLDVVGISVASLGNPYFVALASGATAAAKAINPNVKVTTAGFEQDLGRQVDEIQNFVAAGANLILLNPGDPNALEPPIKKAQAAGIVVVSVDTAAKGADATVTTNNVEAGKIACQYLVQRLHGTGNMIIENGPQNSAIMDRVRGCKSALSRAPEIKLLSDDQNGQSSRDGGLNVMQNLLTRFTKIDAVFTVADPQAIGSDLAIKQLHRTGIIIASVDGSPDVEAILKTDQTTSIVGTAAQDPYLMAHTAMQLGDEIFLGKKPVETQILLDPQFITKENVSSYKGWNSTR